MAHAPPIPPDQQNSAGHGGATPSIDPAGEVKCDPAGGTADVTTREQGRSANIDQNSRQGYQQDR